LDTLLHGNGRPLAKNVANDLCFCFDLLKTAQYIPSVPALQHTWHNFYGCRALRLSGQKLQEETEMDPTAAMLACLLIAGMSSRSIQAVTAESTSKSASPDRSLPGPSYLQAWLCMLHALSSASNMDRHEKLRNM
jgi:hypothetical protein